MRTIEHQLEPTEAITDALVAILDGSVSVGGANVPLFDFEPNVPPPFGRVGPTTSARDPITGLWLVTAQLDYFSATSTTVQAERIRAAVINIVTATALSLTPPRQHVATYVLPSPLLREPRPGGEDHHAVIRLQFLISSPT